MIKKLIIVSAVAMAVTGCLEPRARSIGATLMPDPVMHRVKADDKSAEFSATATGFWYHTGDAYNVEDLNAGGANISLNYRLGGFLSPVFVSATVGGFGGSLKFGCDSDADCDDSNSDGKYKAWLKSKDGSKSYSFWNIQERVLAGLDFNLSKYVILGVAGGAQMYQGNSDYDKMRNTLDTERFVEDVDEKYGIFPTTAMWLGGRFGESGQYGNLTFEYDYLYKGSIDDWMDVYKVTYAHPTGFFGGVAKSNLVSLTLFAGKRFVF